MCVWRNPMSTEGRRVRCICGRFYRTVANQSCCSRCRDKKDIKYTILDEICAPDPKLSY